MTLLTPREVAQALMVDHTLWQSRDEVVFNCHYCTWTMKGTMPQLVEPMMQHEFIETVLRQDHRFHKWTIL